MLMILAQLACSESFWAVAKVRSPHTGPEFGYPDGRLSQQLDQLSTYPSPERVSASGCGRTTTRVRTIGFEPLQAYDVEL